MTEIGVQFSITNAPLQVVTKSTTSRRRKSPIIITPGNLFNHRHQRSHQMQYTAVLPIISLSSMADCKEKFIRMAANNKSIKQTPTSSSPTPTEFRLKLPSTDMSQTKSRPSTSNRVMVSNIPKSSLSYPTTITRPATPHRSNNYQQQQQQQGARFLYVVNTPVPAQRAVSARIPNNNNNLNPLPLHQQPHLLTSPLLPRPHPQYGHFLAYLRRQSLARMRRKQQQQDEEGSTVNPETTTVGLNSARSPSQVFQSPSNQSFNPITPQETTSMPTIPVPLKRKARPLSSYRYVQRSTSSLPLNYRLNLNQSPSLKQPSSPLTLPIKQPSSDQLSLLTPTNSVVDEKILPAPAKKTPYELQLSGDMLNYCYVSDSGVKYQGQLLSTPV